ncbi:unnamed protein product [Brachionus calyciflorus]|uniref:non-specific serine/threonine protein kinase n=1 Tax=Brachionus calyciflorus TaxID=104777 RepID=A0A813SRW3_9BILA|nr:unnamed protein product [Brachionus calyciflorus]
MVQGEINTAVTPSVQTNISNNARMYDNMNAFNMNSGDGEKKKKVGNYIISKTIGEGSFAKVRLGYHLITQQMVAVKVINKREVLKRNYLRANLRREACMMQRMQHPHIIQLYEVMETENCYYIVMELIDGIEFVKYLSKKRSLDENETRDYIRQICSAVDHMHKAKVVHRDIKLQNFMLDQNHNLTIIDFGLSNSLDDREFLNTQCGSPAYAAPEIFAHQDYGSEVDVWSIGVNMYAMLAGKLPFKVENRSKNLAKLHACILKGFELPPFLSPDCQDLLCRLLDPSPSKRIKMSEIFAHPWLNFNSFPVELIPYKPNVDTKEIKMEIVQYLVQKHDYTENDVIDAIVYRKPIALKAIYYLIEKRFKQGLSFPDPDYNALIETNNNPGSKQSNYKSITNETAQKSSFSNHTTHLSTQNSNTNISQTPNLSSNNVIISTNNSNGLVKQNSQLLPKRHNVQLATRSSSQKNVDFKSIFNNMNLNTRKEAESNNESNSPSPDFIAAAVNPIRNNTQQVTSASSIRTSRQTNYADLSRKQVGSNSSINNINNSNNNLNNGRNSATSYGGSQNDYKVDRYFVPTSMNRASPIDEPYQAPVYYQPENRNLSSNLSNNQNVKLGNTNSIRSLPSSIYRGSPERTLPRSPDRYTDYLNNNNSNSNNNTTNSNYYRPTTSRVSSRPSVSDTSEKSYEQKYKIGNYLTTKRSLTSYDEPGGLDRQKTSTNLTNNIIKNRQLHMGKAKIDLDTQTNLNVGNTNKINVVSTKQVINKNSTENIKTSSSLSKHSSYSRMTPVENTDPLTRSKPISNLVHRHSNPASRYTTTPTSTLGLHTQLTRTRTTIQDNSANALPRIKIQS